MPRRLHPSGVLSPRRVFPRGSAWVRRRSQALIWTSISVKNGLLGTSEREAPPPVSTTPRCPARVLLPAVRGEARSPTRRPPVPYRSRRDGRPCPRTRGPVRQLRPRTLRRRSCRTPPLHGVVVLVARAERHAAVECAAGREFDPIFSWVLAGTQNAESRPPLSDRLSWWS